MRYVWAALIDLALMTAALAAPLPPVASAGSNADLATYNTTDAPNGLARCGILAPGDSPCLAFMPSANPCALSAFIGTIATASVPTNVLNVTAVASGALKPGLPLPTTAPGVNAGTIIIAQLTGSAGGIGTYSLSQQINPPPSFQLTIKGDGATQITAANGLCWLATPNPGTGTDLRSLGIKFDGSSDNSAALQSALAWAALGNTLNCPDTPQPALFGTGAVVTLTGAARLSILGGGGGGIGCALEYTGASGSAITLNTSSYLTAFTLRGFTLLSGAAGTATGFQFNQNATSTGTGFVAANSLIDDVTIRGADWGGTGTQLFKTGVLVNGWSWITVRGGGAFGANSTFVPISGSRGYDIESPNGPGFVAIVYNFQGINVSYYDDAIHQGTYTQGITITGGSNFDAINAAVNVPSFTGTGQLVVADNQINTLSRAVKGQQSLLFFHDNYVIMNSVSNPAGLELSPTGGGCQISNNTFQATGTTTNAYGVFFDALPAEPCQVIGNFFWNSGSGTLTGIGYLPASGADTSFFSGNKYFKSGSGSVTPFFTSGATFIADQPQTFATLSPCGAGPEVKGRAAIVSDDTTALTWNAVIAGGGANLVFGRCDGTSWKMF